MYLTTLSQDGETGKLSATDTQAIDLSAINGIWNPCAGSVTPWETNLGSDEYEPEGKTGVGSASSRASFCGCGSVLEATASKANPYSGGIRVEMCERDAGGTTTH